VLAAAADEVDEDEAADLSSQMNTDPAVTSARSAASRRRWIIGRRPRC
jgi:hypothetical protein